MVVMAMMIMMMAMVIVVVVGNKSINTFVLRLHPYELSKVSIFFEKYSCRNV